MGCCCCKQEPKEPEGAWMKHKGRGCTDIIFTLAFIVSFALTYAVISIAQGAGGDPDKVIKPVDYAGRICGVHEDVKDKPYGAWPNPQIYDLLVCTADCAYTATAVTNEAPPKNDGANNIKGFVAPYPTVKVYLFCIPDPSKLSTVATAPAGGTSQSDDSLTFSDISSWGQQITNAMADLINAQGAIAISCSLSVVVAFITVFLVGKFIKCLVYSLLAGVIVFGAYAGFAVWSYGSGCADAIDCTLTVDEANAATYVGYTLWAITFIFFVVMFVLRQRIQIAIEVVKESAHAIADMPFIMLFPFVPILLLSAYLVLWIWGATVIYSVSVTESVELSGDLEVNRYMWGYKDGGDSWKNGLPESYSKTSFDSTYQAHAAWHFFHLLWVMQFFIYFCYLIFAGATADWYFTYDDEDGNKKRGPDKFELSPWPIAASCKRTTLHHIGTVALTSLIIAIIQFIRAVVHYIEKQTAGEPPNQVQKLIFKCIHCCLWLLECCMDKINKNALIWTAVFGTGFCTSACDSFQLLWNNIGRVAAINVVSHLIVAVSKFFTALLTCAIGMTLMLYVDPWKTDVSSPAMPGLLIFAVGYVIGHMFFSIFNAVIDCIFLCFLIDDKFNSATDKGGDAVKMFASEALRKLVGKFEEESKEEGAKAEKAKSRRQKALKKGKVGAADDDEDEAEEVEMEEAPKKKKKKKKGGKKKKKSKSSDSDDEE